MDDPHPDLVVGQLFEGLLDGLGRALDVGLDHDGQLFHVVLGHLGEQVIQGDFLEGGELLFAGGGGALFGQLTGQALVLDRLEQVAGLGHGGQAGDLHRGGGAGRSDGAALVVPHGAHTAHGGARDQHVAGAQGAVLDQQGGHGALALVQTGLDHSALAAAVGVGLQLHDLGLQDDPLQQVADALAGQSRNGDAGGVAAPLLGDQAVLGQVLHDPLGVGGGFIHLVDGHDHLDVGGLGVVDGLDGLGHDAVVGSHHQHRDVGHVGAAGAHRGERLVARGVQEGDEVVPHLDLISADGLGDAAGLARGDVGLADGVQDAGLAVVDVAHDADDRRTCHQIGLVVLLLDEQPLLDGDVDLVLHLGAELLGDQGGGVEVDHVVDGVHLAHLHALGNDLAGLLLEAGGQLADGDLVGDGDLQLCVAGLFQLDALHPLGLGLPLALLELLALALGPLAELLLVALRGGLAAVLGVLGGGQVVVADVEAVHVDVHCAGVHRDLVVLPLDLHCLGRAGLGAGLPGQLAEGDGLFIPLLVGLLGLVFAGRVLAALLALVLVLGLRLLCAAVLLGAAVVGGVGIAAPGGLGLGVLAVIIAALLALGGAAGLLGGGGLGLGLAAVQESGQVGLAVVPAQAVQQGVQLLFFQDGAVLFILDADGRQGIEDLSDGQAGVLGKISHFIFYDHSVISSSCLMTPHSSSRS